MTHLFAEDLAPAAGTVRTARRWLAAWRDLPFPRVVQVQRLAPDGQPIGGVQWAVRADDYDDLIHGRLRQAA
ncbi:MAG: hypothetical protein EPO40_19600 [Myxococcaceae bacterium]|nr:MAG: hypothetical protein EPO40_19600 [Myxococcaceae bacterium]